MLYEVCQIYIPLTFLSNDMLLSAWRVERLAQSDIPIAEDPNLACYFLIGSVVLFIVLLVVLLNPDIEVTNKLTGNDGRGFVPCLLVFSLLMIIVSLFALSSPTALSWLKFYVTTKAAIENLVQVVLRIGLFVVLLICIGSLSKKVIIDHDTDEILPPIVIGLVAAILLVLIFNGVNVELNIDW